MPPIPFTHAPRPPHIDAAHPYTRYFGDESFQALYKTEQRQRLAIHVERDSWENRCTIGVEQFAMLGYSKALFNLNADDMLTLARALIDAAHDLQSVPGRREAEAQQISIPELA